MSKKKVKDDKNSTLVDKPKAKKKELNKENALEYLKELTKLTNRAGRPATKTKKKTK